MLREPSPPLLPSALLRVRSLGVAAVLHPGSLIGRLPTAELSIADPRVSEAHALVSLRERSLKLLALRGPLAVDGHDVDTVELRPRTSIELADGLVIDVESVNLPTHALMLCGAVPGAVELRAAVYSLLDDDAQHGSVRIVVGFVENAAGHLWYSGTRLWLRLAGRSAQPLDVGDTWTIGPSTLRVIRVPLGDTPDTLTDGPQPRGGLVVHARYSTVHIFRAGSTSVLTGKPANLVSELVRFAGKPIPWLILSQQIWGQTVDRALLRKSFDTTIARLRVQLHELGLRDDLVGLDGSGNVELILHPGDRTVDET